MKILIFNALVSSYKGLVAGGMNVTLETNELDPDKMAALVATHRKPVKIMLQVGDIEEGFSDADLEEFKNANMDEYDEVKGKSQSQRLRGVLYILWKETQERAEHNKLIAKEQFHDFYKRTLEEIITHYKSKISEN